MRNATWAALGLVLSAFGCTGSGPAPVSHAVPQVGGGVGFDNENTVQSETALGVAHAFLFTNVVAFYNDFSVNTANPLFDGTTWKRGWSIQGWSTSSDYGVSWDYRGQVSPPPGWATIGADPSVAVDPINTNIVYAVSLAVSDAAFGTISSDGQTTTTYPLNVSDSFCVAQSVDAGQTFPTESVHCRVVSDLVGADHTVDRTAIAVDGAGRVWVAVEDTPSDQADFGILRLFHSEAGSPGTFTETMLPDDGPGHVVRHQILRRDFDGNVWLCGMGTSNAPPFSAQSGLHIFRVNIATDTVDIHGPPDTACGRTVRLDQTVLYNSSQFLRNAHSYDFDFGVNEASPSGGGGGQRVVRFAWELGESLTNRQFIEVAEYDSLFTQSCRVDDAIGSTLPDNGDQLMPSINFTNRAGTPNWWVVYLTSAGVTDPTGPFIHPEAVLATTTTHVNPAITLRTELAPPDWSACTDAAAMFYWGDYFGVTQFFDTANSTWYGISAFSDSRPGPGACTGTRPQHVAASRW